MACSVGDSLRQTPKGHLTYDRQGREAISSIIENVTRRQNTLAFGPVSFSVFSKVGKHKDAKDNKHDGGTKDTLEQDKTVPERQAPVDNRRVDTSSEQIGFDVNQLQVSLCLAEYDEERKQQVQLATERHKKRMDTFNEQRSQLLQKQLLALQEEQLNISQQKTMKKIEQMETSERELRELEQSQKQISAHHAQWMQDKLKEAEVILQKHEQVAMIKKKKQMLNQQRLDELLHHQKTITAMYSDISELISQAGQNLPSAVKEVLAKQKDVAVVINQLVRDAAVRNVTLEDLEVAKQQVKRVEAYVQVVRQGTELAELRRIQEAAYATAAKQAAESAAAAAEAEAAAAAKPLTLTSTSLSTQQINRELPTTFQHPSTTNIAADNAVFNFVCPSALHDYTRLQELLANHQLKYQRLMADQAMKKYKFSLQKAVNIPVNAISPLSGTHVRDKLERLRRLLLGQQVEVAEKRVVSANEHPEAIALCKDLLAKKFVKQGEESVASKYEASFAIATIIIALWADFPDFGHLLLAHFHLKCPATVPYYIPKEEGQSQEDHYRALGYVYTDGVIEKQDKYLKRMSGMIRLYAAIICSPVPRHIHRPHPYGIEHGWTWLCRVLNLDPIPDLTATILFDFLETAGSSLQHSYGPQFFKLLRTVLTEAFPRIRQVTSSGAGGPVLRLENFLQKCIQRGRVPPPEGQLGHNFWFS